MVGELRSRWGRLLAVFPAPERRRATLHLLTFHFERLTRYNRAVHHGRLETILQTLILLLQFLGNNAGLCMVATLLPLGGVVDAVKHHIKVVVGEVGVDRPNRRMPMTPI